MFGKLKKTARAAGPVTSRNRPSSSRPLVRSIANSCNVTNDYRRLNEFGDIDGSEPGLNAEWLLVAKFDEYDERTLGTVLDMFR